MAPIVPILDISTLTDRPRVKIDGRLYELRTRDEFSFLSFRQNLKQFERLGHLLQAKQHTKVEQKEQTRLLDQFCRLVLLADAAVQQRLRDDQRVLIVNSFFSYRRPVSTPVAVHPKRQKTSR